MQNLLLQLQSSILQHQLQSWLVHFAFFSRGHFWACLHHIQKGSFKRVTINITTAPQTLALPHQKISVKDKNLIFNKAVSYLQEYTKIRPKMTRKTLWTCWWLCWTGWLWRWSSWEGLLPVVDFPTSAQAPWWSFFFSIRDNSIGSFRLVLFNFQPRACSSNVALAETSSHTPWPPLC